ncbi:MAG: UvrD-helicase domain-containing protein, partial [Methyloprofundus sp.]|nr:UvrD-helicase domain-containing protein [Methyloprofundus sp.]
MKTELKEPIHYQVGYLASLFARHSAYQSLSCTKDGILLSGTNGKPTKIPYLAISKGIVIEQGIFWSVLAIHLDNGHTQRLGGINKKQIAALQTTLNHLIRRYIKLFYQSLGTQIQQAYQQALPLFFNNQYVRYPIAEQWLQTHQHLATGIKRQDIQQYINPGVVLALQVIYPFITQGHEYITAINAAYVKQQLAEFQGFFDQLESNPLTHNQRKACVIDEQHHLVLAGAGTGKTSTMIGRAGYLIKSGKGRPENILMLAYARKAADEMEQRIQQKLDIETLTVKTFHSLGKQIISQVEGTVPSINKMAEDTRLREHFVEQQMQRLLKDDLYKSRLVK